MDVSRLFLLATAWTARANKVEILEVPSVLSNLDKDISTQDVDEAKKSYTSTIFVAYLVLKNLVSPTTPELRLYIQMENLLC